MANASDRTYMEGEQAFREFLIHKADEYGFSETILVCLG